MGELIDGAVQQAAQWERQCIGRSQEFRGFLQYGVVQKLKERFDAFALKFPGLFPTRPDIFNLSFFGGSWKRTVGEVLSFDRSLTPPLTGDVIDNLPTSESRGIADDYPNYLNALATLDFEGVRRGLDRTQAGLTVPLTALLYLVARHSYLYEHVFTAMRLHHHLKAGRGATSKS